MTLLCSTVALLLACLDGLNVGRGHSFAPDPPVAAFNLLDYDKGDLAQFLPFDGNHRIGNLFNHLLFWGLREDTFNNLDLNEGHISSSFLCWLIDVHDTLPAVGPSLVRFNRQPAFSEAFGPSKIRPLH